MAGIDQKTFWDFAKIVLGKKTSEPSRRIRATYLRTDPDGTGWVQLAGSDGETPVNGNAFASARSGDEVEIALDDGVLSISGNATDPAVGGSMAAGIASRIVEPVGKAARLANDIANAADKVAKAINQHFFTDSSGIHVTNATQEDWEQSHTGPNVLINSLGQLFRNGLTNLLSLLPAQTATDTFEGDGVTATFELTETPTSVVSVNVGGVEVTAYTVSGSSITLATAPSDGDAVVVEYRTSETSVVMWDGLGNAATNVLAVFGEIVRIGRAGYANVTIDTDSIDLNISNITAGALQLISEASRVGAQLLFYDGAARVSGCVTRGGVVEVSMDANNTSVTIDSDGNLGMADGTTSGSVPIEDALKAIAAQSGSVGQSTTVPAGGYADVSVTFGRAYDSTPTVAVGLQSTSSAAAIGQISVAVTAVSATGFTARLFNAGSTDRSPGFCWIAMG